MPAQHKYKIMRGVFLYQDASTKEKKRLQAGDPNNDTIVSTRKLDAIFQNKFLDLGPVDTSPTEGETDNAEEPPASALRNPPGKETTGMYIGASEKGLRIFEQAGPISKGGGAFAYAYSEEKGFAPLNAGKGLSEGKMQEHIGGYDPKNPEVF